MDRKNIRNPLNIHMKCEENKIILSNVCIQQPKYAGQFFPNLQHVETMKQNGEKFNKCRNMRKAVPIVGTGKWKYERSQEEVKKKEKGKAPQ